MSGAVPLAPPASFFTRLLRSPVCVSGTLPVDVQLLIHPPFWFTTNTHPYRWATFIDQQILITNTLSHYLAYILLLTAYCLLLAACSCGVCCGVWYVMCVVCCQWGVSHPPTLTPSSPPTWRAGWHGWRYHIDYYHCHSNTSLLSSSLSGYIILTLILSLMMLTCLTVARLMAWMKVPQLLLLRLRQTTIVVIITIIFP